MKVHVLALALIASIATSSSHATTPSPTPISKATQGCADTVAALRDRFLRLFVATTNCPGTPMKVPLKLGMAPYGWTDTAAVPYGNPGDTCILQHAAYLQEKAVEARNYATNLAGTMDVKAQLEEIASPLEGMAKKLIHTNNRFHALKESLGWSTSSTFLDNTKLAQTFNNSLSTNEDIATGAREALLTPLRGLLKTEEILNSELRNVTNPLQEKLGYEFLKTANVLPQTDGQLGTLDACLGTSREVSSSLLQKSKDLYQNSSRLLTAPKSFVTECATATPTACPSPSPVIACPADLTRPDCTSIWNIVKNTGKTFWGKGITHAKNIYTETFSHEYAGRIGTARVAIPVAAMAAAYGVMAWRAANKRAVLSATVDAATRAREIAATAHTQALRGQDDNQKTTTLRAQVTAEINEATARIALRNYDNQANSWKTTFKKFGIACISGTVAFVASEAYGLPYMTLPTA